MPQKIFYVTCASWFLGLSSWMATRAIFRLVVFGLILVNGNSCNFFKKTLSLFFGIFFGSSRKRVCEWYYFQISPELHFACFFSPINITIVVLLFSILANCYVTDRQTPKVSYRAAFAAKNNRNDISGATEFWRWSCWPSDQSEGNIKLDCSGRRLNLGRISLQSSFNRKCFGQIFSHFSDFFKHFHHSKLFVYRTKDIMIFHGRISEFWNKFHHNYTF